MRTRHISVSSSSFPQIELGDEVSADRVSKLSPREPVLWIGSAVAEATLGSKQGPVKARRYPCLI